jgi:aryl-phospho-beta-D-glucosidase BglC (GH1 family)
MRQLTNLSCGPSVKDWPFGLSFRAQQALESCSMIRFFRLQIPLLVATCSIALAAGSGDNSLLVSASRPFESKLAAQRLHAEGNRLLNGRGEAVRLRGVNIASLEWSNQGEHMREAFDHAIREWKVNLIRLPLAQDRWFGKTSNQGDSGAAYRAIVDGLVDAAAAAGIYLDLDLHWSDCGTWSTDGGKLAQHLMPDQHSVLFWRDVARRYQAHPAVIFGLYNEPHDVPWTVWRQGGSVTEKPSKKDTNQPPVIYEAVGMQNLYDTVRAAGADNLVTVSGLDWGYDLRGVLQGFEVQGRDIIYETHPYSFKQNWERSFGEVSQHFPVFMGEWGGGSKDLDYAHRLMDYADQRGLHWTAWCFHPSCGPPLLKNWSFEPREFGSFVKAALKP